MAGENNITQSKEALPRLLAKAPSASQVGVIFGLAAALAIGVGMVMWALRPTYSPLFTNLGERDVLQITDELQAQNIPFEIDRSTGLILVPNEKVREVRMKLAANGLPRSASVGLELLQQDQSLGTSQFIETARYQHALETELSRTIAAMRNVEKARVHLAIPKQSVFVRQRAKPSASVMVKLYPGRSLEEGQVAAVVHLVASSIPFLESAQVTVVDQWGRLLTPKDQASGMGQARQHFEHARRLEQTYERRIEDLLTPIVGEGAVKAKVNADLDFSENEKTEELFEPDAAQVRSEQIHDQETQGPPGALGIPGALSNQPPGAGTTDAGAKGEKAKGEKGQPKNINKSTTRNYELDKTIIHTRLAKGSIKRLSVAVIVDDRVTVNDKGETVREPLNDKEIELLTALVREAVGYDEERGDSVFVSNRSFQPQVAIDEIPSLALWEQPWFATVSKQVIAGLIMLLILLGIVRPAMRSLTGKRTEGGEDESERAEGADEADRITADLEAGHLPAPPRVYGDILNMARAMAAEDPKRVAIVVKNWVASNA